MNSRAPVAGFTAQPLTAANAARIEQGTPWFGCDLTVDNLPQEAQRDDRAISFKKGCYLGQETVARLDALGHVNWKFRSLRGKNATHPAAGDVVESEGKPQLKITSVTRIDDSNTEGLRVSENAIVDAIDVKVTNDRQIVEERLHVRIELGRNITRQVSDIAVAERNHRARE